MTKKKTDEEKALTKAEKRKRGVFGITERKFIHDNVDLLPHDRIAEVIKRTPECVLKYIQDNRIGKAYSELREAEASVKTQNSILNELRGKRFFADLKEQLTIVEIRYFEDHWVSMVAQFSGDLMTSEEMELKELLIIEVLKNRESSAEKKRIEMKDGINKEIRQEQALPSPDRQKLSMLRADLVAISSASSQYIRNFKDLCDRAEKIRKALHASRQDRVKHLENAKMDFASWLKALEDHSMRLKTSREMAILKKAQDKERERLYKPHLYANNEVNVPILNEDSVGSVKME